MYAYPTSSCLPDFWEGSWLAAQDEEDTEDPVESAPDDNKASQYREAYYAGMADGPVPGTD